MAEHFLDLPNPNLLRTPEMRPITPDSLMESNHSPEANRRLEIFNEMKKRGLLTIFSICGDARVSPSLATGNFTDFLAIQGIAGAAYKDQWEFLLGNGGIGANIALGHYDGAEFASNPYCSPSGCGGHAAFEMFSDAGFKGFNDDVYQYLMSMNSKDVIMQTIAQARNMAWRSNRPTIAALMDHRTKQMNPIAIVPERGAVDRLITAFDYAEDMTSFDSIYKAGTLPFLNISELPEQYQGVFHQNQKQVALNINNPNFIETNDGQDPPVAIISTLPKPPEMLFPGLFDMKSRYFGITLPIEKAIIGNSQVVTARPSAIDMVMNQVNYPIKHSIDGHGFEALRNGTLIINTPGKDLSDHVAGQFLMRPWACEWREKGGQIIVAKTQNGIMEHAEYYKG